MASNAPVSGLAVQTAEKAESSELAQKLPARLSGEVQFCLAEIFRVAINTPRGVADVHCDWSAHANVFTVRVYLRAWKRNADPDFLRSVYFDGIDCDNAAAFGLLREFSVFLSGAWILAGGKGGAL